MIPVQMNRFSDDCRCRCTAGATRLMMAIRMVLMAVPLVFGLVASPLQAGESGWVGDPAIGEARLVSAVSATGNLDQLPLGLEFILAPGWKIYWRTPGEAGLPPVLYPASDSTPGVETTFRWPMPKRFDAFGFDNFGYENTVILPLDLSGFVRGSAVRLSAELEALACKDICVPLQGRLALTLPAGNATPTRHAQAIAQFAAMVPRPANENGVSASGADLRITSAVASRDSSGAAGLLLRFDGLTGDIRDVFIEGASGHAFKAPQMMDGGVFMRAVPGDGLQLSSQMLTVTVDAPPQAGEFQIRPAESIDAATVRPVSLLGIMLIAVLGGLVLNLMPCVLPVLALKLAAVIDAAGAGKRVMRFRFLAGASGIMTSFMLLAAGLALIRIAGGTVGWGIQFQNPVFLILMIVLIGIFALSLIDGVRFPVPAFAQRFGGGSGYRQDFLTGMLATVLATPCSAPFVGTAVAAALSGSMVAHFVIFAAMGAGLAAPWLLVAAMPAAVALLPRPGPWMIWMKRLLALLLTGTMIWLMTVLAAVTGQGEDRQQIAGSNDIWQVWSPAAMQQALDDGTPVFVDVTADWCITCKANKALVLERDPVAGILQRAAADGRLILLQADWTRPDSAIADFLASHERFGIPFNIMYSSAHPDGQVLPELLQMRGVTEALETAGISAK